MTKPHIILIDDQIDVLSTLMQDLEPFRSRFILDDCESAREAKDLLEELEASGQRTVMVISDHIMPEKNGIQFLTELSRDDRFRGIRRVLLTGQASHKDTIDAINNASIDFYISKPWVVEHLHAVVKQVITAWVFDHGMDPRGFDGFLDADLLLRHVKNEGGCKF